MGLKRVLICEFRAGGRVELDLTGIARPISLTPFCIFARLPRPSAAQSSPPPQRKRSNVSSDHVKNKAERSSWMDVGSKSRVTLMGIG